MQNNECDDIGRKNVTAITPKVGMFIMCDFTHNKFPAAGMVEAPDINKNKAENIVNKIEDLVDCMDIINISINLIHWIISTIWKKQ